MQVFAAPLAGGGRAVVLWNRQFLGDSVPVTVTWQQLGFPDTLRARARELFDGADLGSWQHALSLRVPKSGALFIGLTPDLQVVCACNHTAVRHDVRALLAQAEARTQAAECAAAAAADLERWRPWDHGFFGPAPHRTDSQ